MLWTTEDSDTIQRLLDDAVPPGAQAARELERARRRLEGDAGRIAEDVLATSVAHVRGLFSLPFCAALDASLAAAPWVVRERVETDGGNWTIDLVDNEYLPLRQTVVRDPFSALVLAPRFIASLAELSGYGGQEVLTTRRWVNRYGPGDGIAPHDDTTGDFQIMVCLGAPDASWGGTLVLDGGPSVDLQQGDLLVMAHRSVVHWTTPLAADAPCPRITATCRYYVLGGRLPHSKVLSHTAAGPRTRNAVEQA